MDGARATQTQTTAQSATMTAPRNARLRTAPRPARSPQVSMVGPAVRLSSQPASATTASAPPSHIIQLASSSASGQPLPESVLAALESSFGVSLGEVPVHTDARSSEVAAGLREDHDRADR